MMSTGQPIDLKRLEGRLLSLGITLTEAKLDMLYRYAGLLCEYNERLNLTAITDPEGIEEKHFIDSILPLKLFEIPKHASVIDIGTGAGFPGIPWKIAREDIDLCLFDSLRKRLDFLLAVLGSLGLEARLVHGRAEDFGKKELRESFDIAVARAVAGLPVLSEYCLPFVKPGGVLAALKGPDIGLELDSAKKCHQDPRRQSGGYKGVQPSLRGQKDARGYKKGVKNASRLPKAQEQDA